MRIGYSFCGTIWSTISDCEEIALSLYEEKLYKYGLHLIQYKDQNWKEKVHKYNEYLKQCARAERDRKWKEVKIMD